MHNQLKTRMFFTGFAITFFLFSLMAMGVTLLIQPRPSGTPATTSMDASYYLPSTDENITVLFIGRKTDSSAPGTFLLAGFYPFDGKVPLIALPKETAITISGETYTLAEIFARAGGSGVKNALGRWLGISVDRYVVLNESTFLTASNLLGQFDYTLPDAVTVGKGDGAVTLQKGAQILDGTRTFRLITHTGYNGGELERLGHTGKLAAAIVNQKLKVTSSNTVDNIFRQMINLIDTDISYADYEYRLQAAQFLHKLDAQPAVAYEATGSYKEDGRFALSQDSKELMMQSFPPLPK